MLTLGVDLFNVCNFVPSSKLHKLHLYIVLKLMIFILCLHEIPYFQIYYLYYRSLYRHELRYTLHFQNIFYVKFYTFHM